MQLVDLGFELHEMSQEVYEERLSARTGLLSAVQGALSRLRGLDSTASVIKTATAEVCATGGFDRAMLFRLDRSRLVAEAAHFGGDDDWAAAVLDFARRIPPDLGEMLVESELARRRLPGVVQDPKRNPRAYRPLVIATDTNGYVAAPIAPEGRVIGFIHADCHSSGRPLEAADRDVLAAFAEGLGHATANAALRERLRREGRELGTLLRRTGEVVNGLANEGGDLASPGGGDDRREASRWPPTPSVTAPLSLTSRQNEVLRLLAEGATNAEIANRLIVSEHTVKSHIKHILRELGAANRTEAAASYHRLAAESRQV
jgi:DNA-binding CsgD family transcriptional regulator